MDILPPHVPLFTLVLEITVVVNCCFHSSCCFIRVINFLRHDRQAVFLFCFFWPCHLIVHHHRCSSTTGGMSVVSKACGSVTNLQPYVPRTCGQWAELGTHIKGEERESLLYSLVFCG